MNTIGQQFWPPAADGSVEQHTDYYPCGLPRRAVSGVNRRLFEGKEYLTDDGLDEYDYGARRYTPRFGMFPTPDPHGWRTPWLSAYCAFACNPVMNIDPTGRDVFNFNQEGRLVNKRANEEVDRVSIQDVNDLELDAVELEYGTVSLGDPQKDYKGRDIMVMEVKDDAAATDIFELFGDLANVEFSKISLREDEETGLNIITTSYMPRNEFGQVYYISENMEALYNHIRSIVHSHPGGRETPSDDDLDAARIFNRVNGSAIQYELYVGNKKYIPYVP